MGIIFCPFSAAFSENSLKSVKMATSMGEQIMQNMQSSMQEKVEKLQGLQKTQQKTLMARQTLDSQLSENKLVKEELDNLEEGAKVFKLIGPALIRQENTDAKQNVNKRIDYISGELKRQDEALADLDKKQDVLREELQTIQTQMQKLAQA